MNNYFLFALFFLIIGSIAIFTRNYARSFKTEVLPTRPSIISPNVSASDPFPTPDIQVVNTDQWKNYADPLGFSFLYPQGWSVSSFIVKKGEERNRPSRYTISAREGDMKVVELKRGKWALEIVAEGGDLLVSSGCGAQGPVHQSSVDTSYKSLVVGNTSATRLRLEEGLFWAGGDEPDPHPQPIMFPQSVSRNLMEKIGTPGNGYDMEWCTSNEDQTLRFSVTYYSDDFTQKNIQAKTLDYNLLKQMDQILTTFKFTK